MKADSDNQVADGQTLYISFRERAVSVGTASNAITAPSVEREWEKRLKAGAEK